MVLDVGLRQSRQSAASLPAHTLTKESTMSFVLALIACFLLHIVPASFADGTPTALSVSESLLEAFNQHDPDAMAALVTEDFELFYISEGKTALSVAGREGLAAEMTEYFKTRPEVQSRITDKIDGPAFVSFREQIVGGASSLAVYEVRDGLIRRAWYYPAER
jgi:hypothetical protein